MPNDFLRDFVLETLRQNNLVFNEQQEQKYLPQILALLEERIGLELLPKLSKEQVRALAELGSSVNTTPEDWKNFWYGSIPTFEKDLKEIVLQFAEDVRSVLK